MRSSLSSLSLIYRSTVNNKWTSVSAWRSTLLCRVCCYHAGSLGTVFVQSRWASGPWLWRMIVRDFSYRLFLSQFQSSETRRESNANCVFSFRESWLIDNWSYSDEWASQRLEFSFWHVYFKARRFLAGPRILRQPYCFYASYVSIFFFSFLFSFFYSFCFFFILFRVSIVIHELLSFSLRTIGETKLEKETSTSVFFIREYALTIVSLFSFDELCTCVRV